MVRNRRKPVAAAIFALILPALALAACVQAAEPLFFEDFEGPLERWEGLFTRTPETGTCYLDTRNPFKGQASCHIEHKGMRDWGITPRLSFELTAGDICEIECFVKVQGEGHVSVCATIRDENGDVIDWTLGEKRQRATAGWKKLSTRLVVPGSGVQITPRLIGHGPATVWIDDFTFARRGKIAPMAKGETTLANRHLTVKLLSPGGEINVTDKRTGRTWTQRAVNSDVIITGVKAKKGGRKASIQMVHAASGNRIKAGLALDPAKPEMVLELAGKGELPGQLAYPHPFSSSARERLILPVNEGISYPAGDETIKEQWYHTYGGHGLCMPFYGSALNKEGWMAIIETGDDAGIHVARERGNLIIRHQWHPQKGEFGYARRLRYVFFDGGGYVAMCKRYRRYAKSTGLFKTLQEKRKRNPDVDLLIGAANIWTWEKNGLEIAKEMRQLGMGLLLWSHREDPETIKAMNEMEGILTSRYDIYQDLMNPEGLKHIDWVHPDWTQEAWPDDVMIGPDGDWIKGWQVEGKDGKMHPCAVLCDAKAPDYARRRIAQELKTHPYKCRFIDTTTAAPWRECYHKDHPLTRSESKKTKMELLKVVSEEMNLVCGSETGHDAAVPYVHYFEGMLSLGPFRVPDSGRRMMEPWDEVPERVAKFQMGEGYRLPLWELVYHDCVVSTWYWGDYSNKLPKLWAKRDLFNILYGTPPMYMFNREIWEEHKERFRKSYDRVCPIVRMVGYAEMTDHRILTKDRRVQQTMFSNGAVITVNFGPKAYKLPGETSLAGGDYIIRKR